MTAQVRVALLADSFPKLSETFVVAQAAALARAGVDLKILATLRSADGLDHPDLKDLGLLQRGDFASDTGLFRAAERIGRPHRLKTFLKSVAKALFYARRRGRYDALLCHFGPVGVRALRLRRRGLIDGPIWTVFHGFDLSVSGDRAAKTYRALFAAGEVFLPISDYWRDRLIALGCPKEKIIVHHMGVDCASIAFEPRRAGPVLSILTVCRLMEKKGVEYALRALADLKRTAPQIAWRYEIIGEGPLRQSLEPLAGELGLADRVVWRGALPHTAVKQALRRADIFLLPSVTAADGDMEGIPVVLMEAMASGAVVASTVHSGIPELVEHGASGLLAPERDVPALSANLKALAEAPALRASLAARARAAVEARFDNADLDAQLVRRIRLSAGASAGVETEAGVVRQFAG